MSGAYWILIKKIIDIFIGRQDIWYTNFVANGRQLMANGRQFMAYDRHFMANGRHCLPYA